jgi:hypothetical protein
MLYGRVLKISLSLAFVAGQYANLQMVVSGVAWHCKQR